MLRSRVRLARLAAEPSGARLKRQLGPLCLLLVSLGCASSEVLRQRSAGRDLAGAIRLADDIELLSLAPSEGIGATDGPFHGYEILGTMPITPNRSTLAAAIGAAVALSQPRMVACFNPRHGLRIKRAGELTDVVICFECSTLYVERGTSSERFNIEDPPEALLNSWLDSAGIPRAAPSSTSGYAVNPAADAKPAT